MTNVVTAAKLSGTAGAIAVGSATLGATNLLGPDTHISLGVAIAIASVLVAAAYSIARTVTRWEDRLKKSDESIQEIRTMLENLPCVPRPAVPPKAHHCKPPDSAESS